MPLKILLADDSMTAQNMGKKILVDAGYEVVAVSNGAAAIKKVSAERPDLAILDVYMPGYTGLEVCERVKASVETSKIPVLLTVGKMEPFNPEDVNRVKADGVMIKPFEASDLIAAVQSIAQRLLAPTAPPRIQDATLKLKGYEDTLRIPSPRGVEGIPGPKVDHESTLRLTAEQVKAFQDASYKDWVSTTEPRVPESEQAAAPEIAVAAPEPEVFAAAMPAVEEEPAVPAMQFEASSVSRDTPVFSAMSASGVASEHDIFTEAATPASPVIEPAAHEAPAFYAHLTQPHAPEPVVQHEEILAVAEPAPVVEEEVVPVVRAIEPEAAVVVPVVNSPVEAPFEAPTVSVEPVLTEPTPEPVVMMESIVSEVPAAVEAPVLETSAPKTPGPIVVEQAPEFEPTIAPEVETAVAPAQGLEITSAPAELGGFVAREAELVTSSDDMSDFVTKFGVENAEPVHVGIASDLSEEQLAAITTRMEPHPEVHDAVISSVEAAEPVATSPMEEVGEIAARSLEGTGPVVAYVPGLNDTQPIAPVRDEEEEAPTPGFAPVPVMAPETVATEAVSAPVYLAEVEPVALSEAVSPTEPSPVLHAFEAAAAGLAGTAAMAGIAHVLHAEPPVEEAYIAEAPVEVHDPLPPMEPATEEPEYQELPAEAAALTVEAEPGAAEVAPGPEPIGDAALAEELAAALTRKEAEEHVKHAADAVTSTMLASAVAADSEPHEVQGITDSKLADAVARAFDSLKPQLITEIIKELMR